MVTVAYSDYEYKKNGGTFLDWIEPTDVKDDKLSFIDTYAYPSLVNIKKSLVKSHLYSSHEINEILSSATKLPGYGNSSKTNG